MLNRLLAGEVVRAAQQHGIEPAALLAVVEIESNGEPFEQDNVTPRFLFERHIFHRKLKQRAPAKLGRAINEGLAHERWQRATQYQDQATSPARRALLARARAMDEECANRACSWGLGQTMGFHAEALGFANATAMVAALAQGGVAAQIDLMVRWIAKENLLDALNAHDWERFAFRYNGSGFRQNRYDTRLAAAYARWRGNEPAPPEPGALMIGVRGDAVRALQAALQRRGYAPGDVDGIFGTRTREAVIAFQRDHGLQPSGIADQATTQALAPAQPEPRIEKEPTMKREDVLRALLEAALRPGGGQAVDPKALQELMAAVAAASPAAPVVLTSPIDTALGGDLLKGKKTMLAVVAYALLSILQSTGVVGYATPQTVAATPAAVTAPGAASPQAAPAAGAPAPAAQAGAAAPEATAVSAPANGQTPTGTVLTTLILAFGGLGLLAKLDRGIKALGLLAAPRA